MEDELLPPAEVARRLGVRSLSTLTEWDASGYLPAAARTRGGHRRWREVDVASLAERQRQAAAKGRLTAAPVAA